MTAATTVDRVLGDLARIEAKVDQLLAAGCATPAKLQVSGDAA